jgi:hypothetical protein
LHADVWRRCQCSSLTTMDGDQAKGFVDHSSIFSRWSRESFYSPFVILADAVCCMFCNKWLYLLIKRKPVLNFHYHYLKNLHGSYNYDCDEEDLFSNCNSKQCRWLKTNISSSYSPGMHFHMIRCLLIILREHCQAPCVHVSLSTKR